MAMPFIFVAMAAVLPMHNTWQQNSPDVFTKTAKHFLQKHCTAILLTSLP
jgi:hypothetical protein